LRNSNTQGVANTRFFFGNPGDVPLAGDFNKDGCDTVSIYRPSQSRIFVVNDLGSNDDGLGTADFDFYFGDRGDKPFTGDFNNNGQDTVGLHRESTGFVYSRDTLTTGVADNDFFYGDPGDQIVTGRWAQNPDPGPDTTGIFRPSNGQFYLRFSNTQGNANADFGYGNSNMAAIAGDFGALPGGDPAPPSAPPEWGGSGLWRPEPGTTWHWQLSGSIDTSVEAEMFDIDLFGTPQSVINDLHSRGRAVICYMSAGSWEDFRPDSDVFPDSVKGNANGWPGEKWLDIRQLDVLRPIMEARLDLCASKGFDGVEFDNIDGYSNNTGFPLSGGDQTAYNVFLANAAHARGLSAGFKNNVEQAAAQQQHFDFTVNEECYAYNECGLLSPFINANKAVFHVEYSGATSTFCPTTTNLGFSSMKKKLSLNAWQDTCW
jgi:hypothetical protein